MNESWADQRKRFRIQRDTEVIRDDTAPGELGKVIGTRYPQNVEAALAKLSPAERSAFIRRWVAKGLESEGIM